MEPFSVAVCMTVFLILITLPGMVAAAQVRAHHRALTEMEQVADDARRDLRTLSGAYRRQLRRAVHPRVTSPQRRIS